METKPEFTWSCPIPVKDTPQVLMAHGGGGRMMHQLVDGMFRQAFRNDLLDQGHDAAVFGVGAGRMAFTTDSFVVRPLAFPGGDIGSLAVNGTVNDLAMSGARPLYLSCGFILEEGLPMETLWQVVRSMRRAADQAGVSIVTGDTKVVDKGKGDGLYVNTAGVGVLEHALDIRPSSVRPGDLVLVNGDIARHGMAVMALREGLAFEADIASDCAPLNGLVRDLLDSGVEIHCLRDPTRGGLAASLIEIAGASGQEIRLEEEKIPLHEDVHAACEALGLDPLYVANEGKLVAFVPEKHAGRALERMRAHPQGAEAQVIGRVVEARAGRVILNSRIGVARIVDSLSGEQLPRIC